MSELKAETIVPQGSAITLQMYPKAETDAVIAELEERIADGDKDFEMANNQNERLLKIIRHHKYRWCLAMAWWCSAELGMLVSTWESKIKYYKRWQKRWLKLAEKFKEE